MKKALELTPNRPDLLHRLADAQTEAGLTDDARETLRWALEIDSGDAPAYQKLARLCISEGDIAAAAAELERGGESAGREAPTLYREAAALRERSEEYGQALLDYRAMLRALPPDASAEMAGRYKDHLSFLAVQIESRREIDRAGTERPDANGGFVLTVPGGIGLLARALNMNPSLLKQPNALELIFSHLLQQTRGQREALQEEVSRYLKIYDEFLRHMRKKKLLPADFDSSRGQEFLFPFSNDEAALKPAKDLLSFFGVKLKLERSGGSAKRVLMTVNRSRKSSERQALLRNLGVNLARPGLQGVRFILQDETLPSLFSEAVLADKILSPGKRKNKGLLELMILNAANMEIYNALASCTEAARAALVETVSRDDLSKTAGVLSSACRDLDFVDGALALPGSRAAWEGFLGSSFSGPGTVAEFLKQDGGKLLSLYSALKGASRGVQEYFTASPSRLSKLYGLAQAPDTDRSDRKPSDLRRLVRLLQADRDGLWLPIDRHFTPYLGLDSAAGQPDRPAEHPVVRVDDKMLAGLAGREGVTYPARSRLDILEFLLYMQSDRPGMAGGSGMAAIMENPEDAPVFLDLIWDIDPPPEILAKYFDYCKDLARERQKDWNSNRTRTSQSVFYLVNALRREGVLTASEARAFLEKALDSFAAADEGSFALQVAGFLSNELLPALARRLDSSVDAPDLIIAALAVPSPPLRFTFDRLPLQFDGFTSRFNRMKGTTQLQHSLPLTGILAAYEALAELRARPDSDAAAKLVARLDGLKGAEIAGSHGESAELAAHADTAELSRSAALLQSGASDEGTTGLRREMSLRLAAALHPELGVALLTLCYAHSGSPETDALAFDPDFVRKHQFYGDIAYLGYGWLPTRLSQLEKRGSFLAGSLSGLGYQLSRLERSPPGPDLKNATNTLAPVLLAGIRAVTPALQTGRAQEFVALSVRLARELLAVSVSNERVRRWCELLLVPNIPAPRRERVAESLGRRDPVAAADVLTPSELYLVGQAYLNQIRDMIKVGRAAVTGDSNEAGPSAPTGEEELPILVSPAMERLTALLPITAGPEQGAFREEIDQYGIFLRARLGLNRQAFSYVDSYEWLADAAQPDRLYERMCDLKVRIAEICYSRGLPARLSRPLGEAALRDILPQPDLTGTLDWANVLERMSRIRTKDLQNWIERLISFGSLSLDQERAGRR